MDFSLTIRDVEFVDVAHQIKMVLYHPCHIYGMLERTRVLKKFVPGYDILLSALFAFLEMTFLNIISIAVSQFR